MNDIPIRSRVLSALRWSAAARFSGQAITWAVTIVVIRLLTPEDYGLMSMATVLTGFAYLINEIGVIPALIQMKTPSDYVIRQIYAVVISTNILFFFALYAAAPLVASFFSDERLVPITRVLSGQLLIGAFGSVPTALLQREIKFKEIARVEFLAMVLASLMTLAFAWNDAGVWSLVAGSVTIVFVRTVGILLACKFRMLPLFRFEGLGPVFKFGANITGQKILYYFNRQIDVVLVGKLLGDHALGLYSVAYQLATLPMRKIMTLVTDVAFPAYSRIQDDVQKAREYFLLSVEIAALVFFPILWGLSSVSDDFVIVFLGEKWRSAAIVLQLICLIVSVRVVAALLGPLVVGIGRPDIGLRNVITNSIVFPVAVVAGIPWGLLGVCVGVMGAHLLALTINFGRSLPLFNSSRRELFGVIARPMYASLIMYVSVISARIFLFANMSPGQRLVVLIVLGIVIYSALTILINRDVAIRTFNLLRR